MQVRVGGNTQENAELKPGPLENNTILTKDYANSQNPTGTPPIEYTPDLIYMMNNISELVGGVSVARLLFVFSLGASHALYVLSHRVEAGWDSDSTS